MLTCLSLEHEDSEGSEDNGPSSTTKSTWVWLYLDDKNYDLETVHKMNQALKTRQTILATQVVYDIPEEESEWNDEEHDHFVIYLLCDLLNTDILEWGYVPTAMQGHAEDHFRLL